MLVENSETMRENQVAPVEQLDTLFFRFPVKSTARNIVQCGKAVSSIFAKTLEGSIFPDAYEIFWEYWKSCAGKLKFIALRLGPTLPFVFSQ